MTNYTTTSDKADQKSSPAHQSGDVVGSSGITQSPPAYGIDLADNTPVQRVPAAKESSAGQTAAPTKQPHTGLPDPLKKGVEAHSGLAMDDVAVHYNSAKPAQMKALAYTQGTDIYVGPGQERHLPHEAWHVVQQKQGRVQATRQAKGIWLNDETALEREADTMGAKVLQQKASHPTPLPAASSPGNVVQRKVGFELEMQVLIDEGPGVGPEYGEVMGENDYFKVTVDHASRLETMTQAAADNDDSPVPDSYTSIIELVTKPIDESQFWAGWKLWGLMRSLNRFVTKLNTETNGLRRRASLSSIMPGANANAYVSLDEGAYVDTTENSQTTDAYIQATVGLDIAQAPALMEKFEDDPKGTGPLLAEQKNPIIPLISSSATGADRVMTAFKQQFGIADTDDNQSLVNLQGLISMILLYLKTTSFHAHRSETNQEAADSMDNSVIKNATPFLSHTDLALVRVFSLTPDEQGELTNNNGQLKWLTKQIIREAHRGLNYRLPLREPMLKWGNEARHGPTPVKFVHNVLAGDSDGVTDEILPAAKQMDPELIGDKVPGDPTLGVETRRQGPVVEFRTLANKLNNFLSPLGRAYFPFRAWGTILPGIFKAIRALSLRGSGQAKSMGTRFKQWMGDFIINRLN